jgi:hypothetical protein
MANLTMAFETECLLGMIYKAMSNDWQAGLAHLVVVQPFKKFSPDNRISRVKLRSMLKSVTMRDSEDPSIIFEQVSVMRNRNDTVTHQIDEEELIAVVMGAAPKEYVSVITSELRAKGNQMSLEDLEIVMHQQWRQTKGLIDKQATEITLAGLEGYCYQCKQQGHKADVCPNRKPSSRTNGGRTANSGGKQCHMERKCWLKEENASMRPARYQVPNETGNSAVDRKSGGNQHRSICTGGQHGIGRQYSIHALLDDRH